MARKNPIGAIEAFKLAFPNRRGNERLLVKTINGHLRQAELSELLTHVDSDDRIIVVDGSLTRAQINGLLRASNCYVSLHRAEGFGRVIAEAMLLGTPVVATDWSGSSALVNEETAFPVAYRLVNVPNGAYIFEEGSQWAEPSIEAAARALRILRNEPSLVKRRTVAAQRQIAKNHGLSAVGAIMKERLSDIRKLIYVNATN